MPKWLPSKVVYDGVDKRLKIWMGNLLLYMCDARNDTVASNAWRYPDAGCPPGEFVLGAPEANTSPDDQRSMGPWFIPVNNIPGHSGIGIHGGGSCVVPHSMDPYQGWCPTENCIRVQNQNLIHIVDSFDFSGVPMIVVQPNAI